MRNLTAIFVGLSFCLSLFAQSSNTWRYRSIVKNTKVHLVLHEGGECDGTVVDRQEEMLKIKLSNNRDACSKSDMVTLSTANIASSDAEPGTQSKKKEVATVAAATVGTLAATTGLISAAGALASSGHPNVAAGLGLGAFIGVPMLGHVLVEHHRKARQQYVLYVTKLE